MSDARIDRESEGGFGAVLQRLASNQRSKAQKEAIDNLARVIADEGRNPAYHREQIERLQREWPLLWVAIQRILTTHGKRRTR